MLTIILFLEHVNYLAVFCAALAYFILGALWYSVLFGKIWMKGREEMGMKTTKPDNSMMGMMMLKSFAANLLLALSIAFLVRCGFYYLEPGLKLGVVCGFGITLSSVLMQANWQKTKTSVVIIDAAYQVVGVMLVCLIIALWR